MNHPESNKTTPSAFAKTICSICYEDLKPIVEDLQVVSICGHVFHELCLQQWLEYCPAGKKSSCPVCKQCCSQKNISRLYFQSIGEPTQSVSSQIQSDVDAEILREEVKKLEGKLSGFSSAFERQQQHQKELNEELALSKERAKDEEALKEEAMKEKALVRKLLQIKNEELVKSSAECLRLRERSMALAKELATLKLASDSNLEEEQVSKLASIGGGANKDDTIDILKKSLILRNKSYKELMAQCNILGRGETRTLKKLEKAEEKIKKLKTRLQELERALEEKDNEVLRALKASKSTTMKGVSQSGVKWNSNYPPVREYSSEAKVGSSIEPTPTSNQTGSPIDPPFHSERIRGVSSFQNDVAVTTSNENNNIINVDLETDSWFFTDDDAAELAPIGHGHSGFVSKPRVQPKFCEDVAVQKSITSGPEASFVPFTEAGVHGQISPIRWLGLNSGTKNVRDSKLDCAMKENIRHISKPNLFEETLLDNVSEDTHLLPIKRETPGGHDKVSCSGDQCCPGRLLGPEGAKSYAGKWSKRAQSKVSPSSTVQGSSNTGDLISVGADGRGGRIKVLRSQNQFSDGRGNSSLCPKRCKTGAKQGGQSQGCLQIEHFFGKSKV